MAPPTLRFWNDKPYMLWSGLRVDAAAGGDSRLVLGVQDHHRGGAGTDAVNGAVLAFCHDVAQGAAIRSLLDETIGLATISMHIEYRHLLAAERAVVFVGRSTRLGRSVAFGESQALDEAGRLCSRAVGTFKVLGSGR